MLSDLPWLSLLIWLPIAGGVLCLFRTGLDFRHTALITSGVVFVLSLVPAAAFDRSTAALQFVESIPWIDSLNIFYRLGVDGISLPLIVLTTFTTVLVVLAGWKSITRRV